MGFLVLINALTSFNVWASVSFHETIEKEFPRLCMTDVSFHVPNRKTCMHDLLGCGHNHLSSF
jgi:hypothetical protein